MNIFRSFSRIFGGNASGQRKGTQETQPSTSSHDDSPFIGVDGALQVSTVWACVSLLAETISSLPMHVFETDEDENRKKTTDQRLNQVLTVSPNKRQTLQEFWEQMSLNYALRGNAYARIQRAANGECIGLWPMSSDQIEVIVTENGDLMYVYSYDEKLLIFLEKDILHIRGMGNGVVGLSPLDYMRSSVGLAISAQNHTTKTFRKNARRPGILMSDTVLTADQRAALRSNFGDIVSGAAKELYILEAQFKFDPLGMSPADIQLLETRQWAVQDLARWFGVPSVLINDVGETSSLGSSVGEIISGFHRLKLRPQLSRIEQAIEKRVLTAKQRAKGINVEFNLDALLRASLKDRMEIYAKGVQNGIYNRNEPRKKENLKPYTGGEIYTAQVNLMPVDLLGTQPANQTVAPDTIEQ
jgi:HK97 family phage portal protein